MADDLRLCCVCTGNTCRSPLLAALLEPALRRHGVAATVYSAGVAAAPDQPASVGSLAAAARRGIDLSGHRATLLGSLDLDQIDRFCCLGPGHAMVLEQLGVPAERIMLVAAEQGGVPDPYGGDEAVYETTARVLEVAADDLAAALAGEHRE